MEGKENLGFSSKNPTFLVVPDLQRQNTYVYDADRRLSEMTVSYFFFIVKKSKNSILTKLYITMYLNFCVKIGRLSKLFHFKKASNISIFLPKI